MEAWKLDRSFFLRQCQTPGEKFFVEHLLDPGEDAYINLENYSIWLEYFLEPSTFERRKMDLDDFMIDIGAVYKRFQEEIWHRLQEKHRYYEEESISALLDRIIDPESLHKPYYMEYQLVWFLFNDVMFSLESRLCLTFCDPFYAEV